VIRYDTLFIKDSDYPENLQKIPIIKDDLSHFLQLIPCDQDTAFVVAEALLYCYKRFGLSLYHVSDQGTHFKNQVISELNRILQTEHHFVAAYIHPENETTETVNRELKVLKI